MLMQFHDLINSWKPKDVLRVFLTLTIFNYYYLPESLPVVLVHQLFRETTTKQKKF